MGPSFLYLLLGGGLIVWGVNELSNKKIGDYEFELKRFSSFSPRDEDRQNREVLERKLGRVYALFYITYELLRIAVCIAIGHLLLYWVLQYYYFGI